MEPEDIKAILEKEKEEYNKGNWEYIYPYYADSFVFHNFPFPDLVGIEANKENDRALFNAFSNIKFETKKLEIIGDHVYWVWTWEGVHTGVSPTLGIEPTGKTVHLEGCDVLRWRGDKIVEQWRYNNYLAILQQLGMIPAPD